PAAEPFELAQQRLRHAVEGPHLAGPAGTGGRTDLEPAVVVEVGHAHLHAPQEAPLVGEEAVQQRPVPAAERLDMAARSAGTGPHDNVGNAVAADVAAGHADRAPRWCRCAVDCMVLLRERE